MCNGTAPPTAEYYEVQFGHVRVVCIGAATRRQSFAMTWLLRVRKPADKIAVTCKLPSCRILPTIARFAFFTTQPIISMQTLRDTPITPLHLLDTAGVQKVKRAPTIRQPIARASPQSGRPFLARLNVSAPIWRTAIISTWSDRSGIIIHMQT